MSHLVESDFNTGVQTKMKMCKQENSKDSVNPITARKGFLIQHLTPSIKLVTIDFEQPSLVSLSKGKFGTSTKTRKNEIRHKIQEKK